MATTDTWDSPALDQPISADLPAIQRKFQALVKGDPSLVQNPPVGAKRLVEISSGNWQVQQYNGSTWANLGKLQMDVDTVDGHDAAITPQANTIAVRNASGKLEGDITGNAATADSAATLSETLGVELGGTGATTAAQARTNLGVPPTSHGSTAATYGVGNASQYGHLKLSDAVDRASGATGGTAATPAAVKAAKEAADAAQSSANCAQSSADAAMTKASTLATASAPGIVKPGTGMTVDAAGVLNVSLNNTVTSTSTTQAATANAVKTAYDKAVEVAGDAAAAQEAVGQVQADVATKLDSDTVHIVKTWKSGSSWYRKYSDGFIEQGGLKLCDGNNTLTVVTFPISFTSTDYTVTSADHPKNVGTSRGYTYLGAKTTTSFSFRTHSDEGSFHHYFVFNWQACGY